MADMMKLVSLLVEQQRDSQNQLLEALAQVRFLPSQRVFAQPHSHCLKASQGAETPAEATAKKPRKVPKVHFF